MYISKRNKAVRTRFVYKSSITFLFPVDVFLTKVHSCKGQQYVYKKKMT